MLGLIALALFAGTANAGRCDYLVRKADTSKGQALAKAYSDLIQCDKTLAEDHYTRFMASATDSESLAALSFAAINANIWNPVWQQLGKISSYDARDEVAQTVGGACSQDPKIISFLQGAYFGLRDIDFQQWDDAFIACEDPVLTEWMTKQIEAPPAKMFDEKFNALMDIYVSKLHRDALPHLAIGAIKAADAGPYDAILMQINASVAPELGEEMSAEDQDALKSALISVAQGVEPEKAYAVADRLANAGFQEAAAKLLPRVYPDRIQAGGGFLYGAAAIEAGDCGGVKTAIIHYAQVDEPGTRWVILGDITEPLRATKSKLKKCTLTWEEWPVAATPEPVKGAKDINLWVDGLVQQWSEKGYEVKSQSEKAIKLD